jgi:hypothetical protein
MRVWGADDAIVETVEPGLAIGADLRAAIAVAVARHRNLDRAIVADHGFARTAAAAVTTAAAGRLALLVSQRRA